MQPFHKVAYSSRTCDASRNRVSRRKNYFLSFMSPGAVRITDAVTTARMNKLEPSNTAIPIWMPDASPPSEADRLANTSGAPAPKASKVTPASDSESLKVLESCWSDGLKCSSAT